MPLDTEYHPYMDNEECLTAERMIELVKPSGLTGGSWALKIERYYVQNDRIYLHLTRQYSTTTRVFYMDKDEFLEMIAEIFTVKEVLNS